MTGQAVETKHEAESKGTDIAKFVLCSALGIFMFFVSVTFGGKSTIPLDHLTTIVRGALGEAQKWVVLAVIAAGAALPFVKKTWNQSTQSVVFSVFKVVGLICGIMYMFHLGPEELHTNADLFPFLYVTLCCSLCFLIPIGAVFLSFLTDYGLMEFVAVFLQPVMRKIWKTPGRSAIDAVASFVGSYSLALLITDRLYQKGRYNKKEAFIIATGFSTVSTTFMVVVAKTLGLMDRWNFYFWTTLVITFIVTAIVARIYPTSKVPDEYMEGVTPDPEPIVTKDRLNVAWTDALTASHNSGSIVDNVVRNTKDGCRMVANILPTIMSIGFIGMLIALFTPVFNIIGYVFYPFTMAVQLPEAMTAAKAISTSIAEMFLPAAFVAEASIRTKYVIAVSCISELLFFSAVIPCILSTKIPVTIPQLLILWVERVILSILLAGAVALLVL